MIDRAEALPVAREVGKAKGLLDVVDYREGNLLEDGFGHDDVDVALLCNILHHFDADTNRAVLARVHAALRPGGTVAVFDLETPPPTSAPEGAADAFSLFFRITSTSACFRGDDYGAWLASAGFSKIKIVRSVWMPSRMLAVGSKA